MFWLAGDGEFVMSMSDVVTLGFLRSGVLSGKGDGDDDRLGIRVTAGSFLTFPGSTTCDPYHEG